MKISFPRFPVYAKKWLILDLLGGVAGVLGGLGAVVLHLMIETINHFSLKYCFPVYQFT